MKKKAAPKRKVYKTKLEVVNIKMTKEELASLRARAEKYLEGNLSGWLRQAGLEYTPRPKLKKTASSVSRI